MTERVPVSSIMIEMYMTTVLVTKTLISSGVKW